MQNFMCPKKSSSNEKWSIRSCRCLSPSLSVSPSSFSASISSISWRAPDSKLRAPGFVGALFWSKHKPQQCGFPPFLVDFYEGGSSHKWCDSCQKREKQELFRHTDRLLNRAFWTSLILFSIVGKDSNWPRFNLLKDILTQVRLWVKWLVELNSKNF